MSDRTRGPYRERERLAGPKRLLALDGGGIRGVMTLEVLHELENQLGRRTAPDGDFVLADYFDYIAGTSTGGIIAAGLSLGMPVARLQELYASLGEKIFRLSPVRAFWSLYSGKELQRELDAVFGDRTIGSDDLRTLLLVTMKNRSTDSPWPLTNCTSARYNDRARSARDGRASNLDRLRLADVVRASTAAPVFFPAVHMDVPSRTGDKRMLFVDGGVSPYNNPALLLFLMATHPAYGLGWATGVDDLLLVSVGTGSRPQAVVPRRFGGHLLSNLRLIPSELLGSTSVAADLVCRSLGWCTHGGIIDQEVDRMLGEADGRPGKQFTYARYDAMLTREGLDELGLAHVDPKKVARLAGVDAMPQLCEIGRRIAADVDLAHLGSHAP